MVGWSHTVRPAQNAMSYISVTITEREMNVSPLQDHSRNYIRKIPPSVYSPSGIKENGISTRKTILGSDIYNQPAGPTRSGLKSILISFFLNERAG